MAQYYLLFSAFNVQLTGIEVISDAKCCVPGAGSSTRHCGDYRIGNYDGRPVWNLIFSFAEVTALAYWLHHAAVWVINLLMRRCWEFNDAGCPDFQEQITDLFRFIV